MNKIIPTIISLILLSSLASASYYIQSSNDIQDYDDSMYLHPDFAPKADIFYTPFNAYRTYCDASYCPDTTKIIQIQKVPVKVSEPKLIIIRSQYPCHPTMINRPKPIRPIFLN